MLPYGKRLHNYGKSPCLMRKLTHCMAIFNSYVELQGCYRQWIGLKRKPETITIDFPIEYGVFLHFFLKPIH